MAEACLVSFLLFGAPLVPRTMLPEHPLAGLSWSLTSETEARI